MITRFLWQGMGPSLRVGVLFVLAIGIILPLLNQLMPATSAFYVPAWVLQLIGKYLCFASLALAFQLTNFVRDVREDWDLDRVYLPAEDLERFVLLFGIRQPLGDHALTGPRARRFPPAPGAPPSPSARGSPTSTEPLRSARPSIGCRC